MKKVGLAVVTYKDNFGSALQTYATQYMVEKLGYQVECISTDGIMGVIESKKKRYYLRRIFHPEEFKYLLSYVTSKLKKQQMGIYAENMKIRHNMYAQFSKRYLRFSKVCTSIAELTMMCNEYDTVLVGSDQLWRPSNIAGGYFTLEFVPEKVNKVAYSTSFGVAELPKYIHQQAKTFLSRMNHISVRENSGKEIVKDLIGENIPVVCDPTMLMNIEEWRQIQKQEPIIKGNYIVCYLMGTEERHRDFVKRLREKTGYKVIGLLHGSTYIEKDEEWPDENPYDIGPCEFMNLIRYAKYVCTDSFHCCVFSILNKTQFFVFRRDKEKKQTSSNDRIYTLLSWTGLSKRLLNGDEEIASCLNSSIDFSQVQTHVNAKREESLAYLSTALMC